MSIFTSLFCLFELRKLGRRKKGSEGKEHRTASEGIVLDTGHRSENKKIEKLKPVIYHRSLVTIFA